MKRRVFLKSSALAGALVISVPIHALASGAISPPGTRLNIFLMIDADGGILVTAPIVDMGQGAQTSLAMVIADELGADWSRIRVEPPPADPAYQRPDVTKYQLTSGSWSIRLWYAPMRHAGAAARQMLVGAAAARWGVDAAACEVEAGRVIHRTTGRSLGFGELAAAAAKLPVPEKPLLKTASQLRFTGRSFQRLDIPRKVDGSGVYGIDVEVPGMVYAALVQSPVYGAKLQATGAEALGKLPGLIEVVATPEAAVVVAQDFWSAKSAAAALRPSFEKSAFDDASTEQLMADERQKLGSDKAVRWRSVGDSQAAQASAVKTVTADYTVPFLHHATLEPMNCTASVTDDWCELWVPTQCHTTAMEAARRLTGLPESRIRINATLLGGGFGRRIHTDFIEPAILASKKVKRPVKLIYTREEDMQHGFHRPAMAARLSATFDAGGNVSGIKARIVGPSVHEKFWPEFFKGGLDASATMGVTTKNTASNFHYAIPAQYMDYVYQPTHVPIGYWRSVGASHNGFFMEAFIDELAEAAGQDAYRFRRGLLRDSPRGLAVLDKAAELAAWGGPLPKGHGLGIAFCENVESMVAEVAEVSVLDGLLRVHKVFAVIDCGTAINPDTIVAQMQGGIVNALSAVLGEEITIKDGRSVQSNFHDYPVLRMAQSPQVTVHIIEGGGALGGVGEAMVPTLAPAVTNAVFAATGQRVRALPLRQQGFRVSL